MNTSRVHSLRAAGLSGLAIVALCAGGWTAAPARQEPAPNPNVEKLLTTRECRGCDFTNTTIVNRDLSGVDLAGANFEGGGLYGCNLTGANLSGVNLRGAVMRRSDLNNVTWTGADLSGADLSFASNANLQAAGTTPTTTCPDLSKGPCQ